MRAAGVAAIVAFVLTAAAAAAPAPSVRLVRASPVVVAGAGYAPHARVLLRYRSGAVSARHSVVASAGGSFRVTLARLAFSRCDGLTLAAGAARLVVPACAAPGGRPALSGDLTGTVQGTAFVPGERVALSARAGDLSATAKVVADAQGAFAVRLDIDPPHCASLFFRAAGALGSTAVAALAAPECAAP
jgi:hypothetical protein